jgi:hypothetical protein
MWQSTDLELRRAEANGDAGGLRPGHAHPEPPPPPARGRRRGKGTMQEAAAGRERNEPQAGRRGREGGGEEGGSRAGDGQGHGARCFATLLCYGTVGFVWLRARCGERGEVARK